MKKILKIIKNIQKCKKNNEKRRQKTVLFQAYFSLKTGIKNDLFYIKKIKFYKKYEKNIKIYKKNMKKMKKYEKMMKNGKKPKNGQKCTTGG